MVHEVEKEWITRAGLRARVLVVENAWRCGYVAVGPFSALRRADYDDDRLSGVVVHGGLTYAGRLDVGASTWWFGFDAAHAGDGFLPGGGPLADYTARMEELFPGENVVRDLDYMVQECEHLAEQLAAAGSWWRTAWVRAKSIFRAMWRDSRGV